jgi:hypothetical protein
MAHACLLLGVTKFDPNRSSWITLVRWIKGVLCSRKILFLLATSLGLGIGSIVDVPVGKALVK